jgi:hypothetical protein
MVTAVPSTAARLNGNAPRRRGEPRPESLAADYSVPERWSEFCELRSDDLHLLAIVCVRREAAYLVTSR